MGDDDRHLYFVPNLNSTEGEETHRREIRNDRRDIIRATPGRVRFQDSLEPPSQGTERRTWNSEQVNKESEFEKKFRLAIESLRNIQKDLERPIISAERGAVGGRLNQLGTMTGTKPKGKKKKTKEEKRRKRRERQNQKTGMMLQESNLPHF